MGPWAGSNETNGAQIGLASAEETESQFYLTNGRTDGRTDICSVFDSESICIREGGSSSLR